METPIPEEATIFNLARQLQGAEARRLYLDRACGGNNRLAARIEALLQVHEQERSFLETPPMPTRADTRPLISDGPGTQIGAYKLVEKIGEGGFGVVFLAEQRQPLRRTVALKILKPGMDSRAIVARFEAERQALALMDHPNIARVVDGGETASGRPYFVMELVKGVPITRYCDEQQFTLRERLSLFTDVCRAVQHAHQKGIIHRDLKPTNVLVAAYDGQPVPKVIDFGVAKALGERLTERTLVTGFGGIIGTLEYLSPEAAELNARDIDTRADIYSLGVLLYELLTGTTPLTQERVEQASTSEVLRAIREEDPPRPSARLSALKNSLASISAQRKLDPALLTRTIRGELDWIVMKALDKDRSRRYATANDLARDIEHYLRNEPVEACPPSAGYRLGKFARRHWRALTAICAFVLLLVSGVVTLTVTLVAVNRERREKQAALEAEGNRRKQARAALDAMSSQIIEEGLAKQPALLPEHKQFLEQALRFYEEFAADTGQQEESRAGAAHACKRVGEIRERLGEWKDAEAAWERSRQLYAELVADFPDVPMYRQDLARVHQSLGNLYGFTGRMPEAEGALRQARTIYRSLAAAFPDLPAYQQDLTRNLISLGVLFKNLDRLGEAEEVYGQARDISKQLADLFPSERRYQDELAQTHLNLGGLLDRIRGRSQEAEDALGQAAAIYQRLATQFPRDPHYRDQLAISRNNLGNVLRDAGRHTDAEQILRQALTIRKQLVADFPAVPWYRRGLAITLNNLGILFKNTDGAQEAEEMYRQSLAVHEKLAEDFPEVPDHQNEVAGAMVNLARLLLARKELDGARQLLEDAEPHHQAALKASPRHPAYRKFYRNNRWRMTETLLEMKDHAAAAAAAGQFLEAAVEPPRDAYTAACLLAGCVRLAAEDERLVESKRQELVTAYGDRAIDALRLAIEKGAKEIAQMKEDPNLDPLRPRKDFRKLVGEFKAKGRP
jgi:serine/threonine protein kinase/tetratricopeptide (TPR) repeat protein